MLIILCLHIILCFLLYFDVGFFLYFNHVASFLFDSSLCCIYSSGVQRTHCTTRCSLVGFRSSCSQPVSGASWGPWWRSTYMSYHVISYYDSSIRVDLLIDPKTSAELVMLILLGSNTHIHTSTHTTSTNSRFLPLLPADLQEMKHEPEQFFQDNDSSSFEYQLRPCAEHLCLSLLTRDREGLAPVMMELLQARRPPKTKKYTKEQKFPSK